MIYVKINDVLYPASIAGKTVDKTWDNRESKSVTLEGDFSTINSLFKNNTVWSIVNIENIPIVDEKGNPVIDENGEQTYTTQQSEYDNSAFCIRGDLIVHVDGTCTVKMAKLTELEEAYELLYGGVV